MFLSYVAAKQLILAGGDVNNAYFYSHLNIPIIMEQNTNSTQKLNEPDRLCVRVKSLYGARQAAKLWGCVIDKDLKWWGFTVSQLDRRLYFKHNGASVIIVLIIVYDMEFSSNYQITLADFKTKMKQNFDVKFYGALRQFVGCSSNVNDTGMKIHQKCYAKRLISRYIFSTSNAVITPIDAFSKINLTDYLYASPIYLLYIFIIAQWFVGYCILQF